MSPKKTEASSPSRTSRARKVTKTTRVSKRPGNAVPDVPASETADVTAETPSAPRKRVGRPASTAAKSTSAVSAARRTRKKPETKEVAAASAATPAVTEAAAAAQSDAVTEATIQPAPRRRGRPRKVDSTPAPEANVATAPRTRRTRQAPKQEKQPVETHSQDVAPAAPESIASAKDAPVPGRTRAPRKTVSAPNNADPAGHPSVEVEPAAAEETATAPPEAPAPVHDDRPLFSSLGLSEPVMRAIEEMGYLHPTPIQAAAIPVVLSGRDVLGVAQTGTGKTASFTLPMLERLAGSRARARMPRSLILEPTRELALQVAENFRLYGKYLRLNHALLIGGESMSDQRAVLNQGVDVLIATPGRLIDLFERGGLLLNQTRLLVIDEADRMLDMGFIPDIERIVGLLPQDRQTLFFSATMAPEIRKLADNFLKAPEEITVARAASVATTIEEALIVVDEHDKRRTLRKLLRDDAVQNAIIFCNRKRDVDTLYKSLHKHHFAVGHLHGDLPQSVRSKTLERFKSGELKILVCSDVAARGIDVSGLSHVFNFDLPFHAEDYVHRIGRTGRAGNQGHAFSLASPHQKNLLDAIEALIKKTIPQPSIAGIDVLPWADPDAEPPRAERRHEGKNRKGGNEKRVARDDRRPQETTPPVADQKPARPHRPAGERQSVSPVNEFDHGAPPTGFGSETPAFMLFPRRRPRRSDEAQQQGPVQHRGEA